jgi:hypothetical protein
VRELNEEPEIRRHRNVRANALLLPAINGEVVISKFRARRYCKLATWRLPAIDWFIHPSGSPIYIESEMTLLWACVDF